MAPTTSNAPAHRGPTKGRGEKQLISLDALGQAAECLRTLAHPHRLRIVEMLLGGRYTVYYAIVEPHLANIMNCIADRFSGKERR